MTPNYDPIFDQVVETLKAKMKQYPPGYDTPDHGANWSGKPINPDFQRIPAAEHVLASAKANIQFRGDHPAVTLNPVALIVAAMRGEDPGKVIQDFHDNAQPGDAAYDPDHDSINLPPRTHFKTARDFYAAAFHELSHWTGAEHRLSRVGITAKGCDSQRGGVCKCKARRMKEEFTAEISSAMICATLGLDSTDHAAQYLANWSGAKGYSPEALEQAFADARRAAHFILKDA